MTLGALDLKNVDYTDFMTNMPKHWQSQEKKHSFIIVLSLEVLIILASGTQTLAAYKLANNKYLQMDISSYTASSQENKFKLQFSIKIMQN